MVKQSHYSVYRDKRGGYRFKLVAPNGETVATSESYGTRRAVLQSVAKMAGWAATTNVEEVKAKRAVKTKKA